MATNQNGDNEDTPAWLKDDVKSLSQNVASSPAVQEYVVTSAINSISAPGGLSKLVFQICS